MDSQVSIEKEKKMPKKAYRASEIKGLNPILDKHMGIFLKACENEKVINVELI